MKKLIVTTLLLIVTISTQAQVKLGIKAGANFSDLDGNFDTSMKTGFHAGAVVEIKAFNNFSLQPEVLYSMQGAKVTFSGAQEINFSYITVPVMARYYLLTDTFSLDAGPQFAFLIDDNIGDSVANTFKSKSFDFAVAGGATLNITKSFFASGRYVIGLTEASSNADIKNRVIQLSLGYTF